MAGGEKKVPTHPIQYNFIEMSFLFPSLGLMGDAEGSSDLMDGVQPDIREASFPGRGEGGIMNTILSAVMFIFQARIAGLIANPDFSIV